MYVEPRGVRTYDDPGLLSWDELLELGARAPGRAPRALDERWPQAAADDVATLIYTSGTTGPPKGAMLTVANVDFAIKVLVDGGGFARQPPGPTTSSCRTCRCATWPSGSSPSGSTPPPAPRSTSPSRSRPSRHNLREVQPTLFFAVPRIWEKIRATRRDPDGLASPLKRANYRLWMGRRARIGADAGRQRRHPHPLTRLRYALGYSFCTAPCASGSACGRCRYAASGAAPIAPELLQWFMGIGVPMHEVYGMTENSAVATANRPGRVRVGTVGEPQPGVELRIDEATGEVLTRHRGVFAGYWRNPEATAAGDRGRRLAAHRRRRRVGRRHAPEDHRPAQGHHHHRRRQEHLARPRSRTRSRPRPTSRRRWSSATAAPT